MMHQLTSEARHVGLAGFSPRLLKARLRAFNLVNYPQRPSLARLTLKERV
jgi:hypothetical protein